MKKHRTAPDRHPAGHIAIKRLYDLPKKVIYLAQWLS
jgi:hypothetical protein